MRLPLFVLVAIMGQRCSRADDAFSEPAVLRGFSDNKSPAFSSQSSNGRVPPLSSDTVERFAREGMKTVLFALPRLILRSKVLRFEHWSHSGRKSSASI